MSPIESRSLGVANFLDLAARARAGIFLHLPLWLLISWMGELWIRSPLVYFGGTLLFALILISRLAFEQRLARAAATAPAARAGFVALLLSNPCLWGFVATLSIVRPEMSGSRSGFILTVAAMAAGGGMTLVIEPWVRRAYPLLAMAPPACALFLNGNRSDTVIAVMATLMTVYVLHSSRVVHADYWNAVESRAHLEQRAMSLEWLSNTDALTQLRNRPHFDKQLAVEWARSRRSSAPLALLIIDLDHFKKVNDGHGHAVGDACLRAAAAALLGAVRRPDDLVARYGGEEFAAILPATTAEGAESVAEGMRMKVAAIDSQHEGHSISLSCSIGVHTVIDFERCSISQALACADRAMYEAKAQGRNRVVSMRQSTEGDAPDPIAGRSRAVRPG